MQGTTGRPLFGKIGLRKWTINREQKMCYSLAALGWKEKKQ